MKFKRFFLMIPALALPYVVLLTLVFIYTSGSSPLSSFIMENIFLGFAPLVLIPLSLYIFIAIVFSIVFILLACLRNWDALSIAKTAMIVKLVQIPAYIIIFVLSMALILSIWLSGLSIVLLALNCITLFMTGLFTISGVICGAKQGYFKVSELWWVILLQFVFCLDVLAAVIFYVKFKRIVKEKDSISVNMAL